MTDHQIPTPSPRLAPTQYPEPKTDEPKPSKRKPAKKKGKDSE
jgi:hypothetical protein